MVSMAKHRRDRPRQPGEGVSAIDPVDPLAAYTQRRLPPIDGPWIHRPLHGHASHIAPGSARLLLEWDGFAYQPVGTAPDLAAARAWARGFDPDYDPNAP